MMVEQRDCCIGENAVKGMARAALSAGTMHSACRVRTTTLMDSQARCHHLEAGALCDPTRAGSSFPETAVVHRERSYAEESALTECRVLVEAGMNASSACFPCEAGTYLTGSGA